VDIYEQIKSGELLKARSWLIEEIKKNPGAPRLRTLYFQVLIFLGEWEKARKHLEAVPVTDEGVKQALEIYKSLVAAEQERLRVRQLEAEPSFLPEIPQYYPLYLAGVKCLAAGDADGVRDAFQQIDSQLDDLTGTVNGKEFTGFRNTDSALGYFLEAFVHGRYVMVPYEEIREILMNAPETLYDLIWPQAALTTWSGLSMNCFLPALYPESYQQEDELLKIGRVTDWVSLGGGFVKGLGQQVFDIGGEDMAILEMREIQFNISGNGEDK